jgi:hypothetical protein
LSNGLIVYNLGSETEGEALDAGLYVLQAGLWKPAGGGGDIPVATVSITPNTPSTLGVGNSKQLYFLTSPPNATYPSMSWSSSKPAVATVNDLGVVTGVAPGYTTITLTLGSVTSDPVAVTVVTCGSPFTAPSGKVYNTAAYNNDNLTNLCWTTTNLQEAGYSATCYMNDCDTYPTRGYYYARGGQDIACASLNSGGTTWRAPTNTEWEYLQIALPSLAPGVGTSGDADALLKAWNQVSIAAGHYDDDGPSWKNWNSSTGWRSEGTGGSMVYLLGANANQMLVYIWARRWFPARCVRDL